MKHWSTCTAVMLKQSNLLILHPRYQFNRRRERERETAMSGTSFLFATQVTLDDVRVWGEEEQKRVSCRMMIDRGWYLMRRILYLSTRQSYRLQLDTWQGRRISCLSPSCWYFLPPPFSLSHTFSLVYLSNDLSHFSWLLMKKWAEEWERGDQDDVFFFFFFLSPLTDELVGESCKSLASLSHLSGYDVRERGRKEKEST